MIKSTLCVGLLLLGAVQAWANPISIPDLFGTGVDGSGNPLGNLAVDSHYQLVTAPVAVVTTPNSFTYADISPVLNVYPGSWVSNSATSQWIGPNTNIKAQGDPGWDSPPDYTYNLTFSLAGLDPSTADIFGQWATDNTRSILINGIATGIVKGETGYGSLDGFEINAASFPLGTFLPGLNTLSFVVTNVPLAQGYVPPVPPDQDYSPTFNPTGLRVDALTGTANAVPEPSTLVLLGLGGMALAALRRRKV